MLPTPRLQFYPFRLNLSVLVWGIFVVIASLDDVRNCSTDSTFRDSSAPLVDLFVIAALGDARQL